MPLRAAVQKISLSSACPPLPDRAYYSTARCGIGKGLAPFPLRNRWCATWLKICSSLFLPLPTWFLRFLYKNIALLLQNRNISSLIFSFSAFCKKSQSYFCALRQLVLYNSCRISCAVRQTWQVLSDLLRACCADIAQEFVSWRLSAGKAGKSGTAAKPTPAFALPGIRKKAWAF